MPSSQEIKAAIGEQIDREFEPSLEYVAIASSLTSEGLTELVELFYRQAEEERDHAMHFGKYYRGMREARGLSQPFPRPTARL